MTDTATPETETEAEPVALLVDDVEPEGAIRILRRGLKASPELRNGLLITLLMGLTVALGKLVIPVLIERTLDQVSVDDQGEVIVDTAAAVPAIIVTFFIIIAAAIGSWLTQRRLIERAEQAIANLRVRAFRRVHNLSIADHNETQRGVLVGRVTSDAEALARFVQWGLYSWTIHPTVILGTFAVLAYYSWQVALIVLLCYAPVIPVLRWLQRRQLAAYDDLRTRVGEMLTGFSEAVMGAAVIRAYGVERQARRRLDVGIQNRYNARLRANRYMAGVFVAGDFFGAIAFSGVLILGVVNRDAWGLTSGELVACLFLTTLLNGPIAELGETLDQTQTAVAGWRKILNLLDYPIDVVEAVDGKSLEPGAIEVSAVDVEFSYRDGERVLEDLSFVIPAGTNVAVVGETGSGKSTLAKLLCRLADPTAGQILFRGVSLAELHPDARHEAVRMVPQDGFLFDTTVRENIRFGRPGASDGEIDQAFELLGLTWWKGKLANGLDTEVGERGENLSVGERQLVALVRAALANPGLLILDEATSAVDPETDQALTTAIRRLAEGRTLISIAHRLATAEAADLVMVFDQGHLVEQGHHLDLIENGGIYARLFEAWQGNITTV